MITEADARAALPAHGILRQYVDYAVQCTDAHAAFHILGGLTILAQSIPEQVGVPIGGMPLYGNIYALCIGPSTLAKKSFAVTMTKHMLVEAGYKNIAESPGSAEGLLEEVRANQGKLLITYSEFGSFLAQTEKGYATPIKTLLTEAYDGSSLGRALANKRRGAIDNPRVSVFGGSTLEFLERHTEPVDWTGGFLGRFLTMYTNPERTYSRQPAKPAGFEELRQKISDLTNPEYGGVIGECQGFSPKTDSMWDDWFYAVKKRVESSHRETRAAMLRALGMAHKIALLLSWDFGTARGARAWYVGEEELFHAIKIVELHIESVLEIGDHLAPSKDLRDRIAVLNSMPDDRGVSFGQIITQSKVGLRRRVRDLLDTLEEEGYVKRVVENDGTSDLYYKQGKPSQVPTSHANGHANGRNGHHGALPEGLPIDLEAEDAPTPAPFDLDAAESAPLLLD